MSRWQPRVACLILAMIFLSGIFIAAENVTVVPDPTVVGPHLRLTVLLHGQPVKDAKVSFYSAQNELKFVRLSNANGVVIPPRFQPGVYRIEAQFSNDVVCGETVNAVKHAKSGALTLDLTPEFDAHQAWLQSVEELPIAATVKEFSGTIFDPTNAPIPNAEVRVVRRGIEFANKTVLQLKSDADGHFSAQLGPGEYIAFVSETGFRTKVVPFVVSGQGEGAIRVVLDVGSVTQTTVVSAMKRIQQDQNY